FERARRQAADRPLTPGAPPRTLAAKQPPWPGRGERIWGCGGAGAPVSRGGRASRVPGVGETRRRRGSVNVVPITPEGRLWTPAAGDGTFPALRNLLWSAVRGWPL